VAQGAKIIVIACNSVASVATERLRREFNLPIFEVITPAVEQAVKISRSGRIGVIGTTATIRSGAYETAIKTRNPGCKVFARSCPLLVPLVEEGWTNKRETKMILRRYLHPLKDQQLDTLILGCTHYPLLKHLIQPRIGRKVNLIDSSEATAAHLKAYLERNSVMQPEPSHDTSRNTYFVTDITVTATTVAAKLFGRQIDLHPL
jgi:glutamate racemase